MLRKAVMGRLPVFVAGLYCFLVAVLPVGFAPSASGPSRLATWVCLLSLLVSLFVPPPRLSLLFGTVGFLGGALLTFGGALLAGEELPAPKLAVLGFFALSLAWGALSSPAARQGVGQGTVADWLSPRRTVARWQLVLAALALLALPLLLLLPLTIQPPAKATFALVLALGLVLLLAHAGSAWFTRIWLRDAAGTMQAPGTRKLASQLTLALLAAVALLLLVRP